MATEPPFEVIVRETVKYTASGHGYYRVLVEGEEVSKHTTEREALESAANHYVDGLDVRVIHDYEVKVVKTAKGKIVRVRVKTDKLKLNTPMAIVTYTSPSLGTSNPDSVPNSFSFATQTDVAISTEIISEYVEITGMTLGATISISGAGNPFYEINGSGWTQSPGTIYSGQEVRVKHESSAFEGQDIVTTLNIEGVEGTFTSTTEVVSVGDWQLPAGYFQPAKFPARVIYPRPDSSGEVGTHARHKYCHSQMEYQIPVVVFGGAWPFRYELIGPSGATIGSELDRSSYQGGTLHTIGEWYGIVRCPGATAAGTYTVNVYDQDSGDSAPVATTSWTVTQDDSKFTFINSAVGSSGIGTIGSPLKDWSDYYQGSNSNNDYANKILVFRTGTYTVTGEPGDTEQNSIPATRINSSKAAAFIAYPGDTPVFDMSQSHFDTSSGYSWQDGFVAGITFDNAPANMNHTRQFTIASGPSRLTFWKNTFQNIANSGLIGNDNPACCFIANPGFGWNYFSLVQNLFINIRLHSKVDNSSSSNGAYFDVYQDSNSVWERNETQNSKTTWGFWPKSTNQNYTFRANTCNLVSPINTTHWSLNNGPPQPTVTAENTNRNFEVCWNYFRNPTGKVDSMMRWFNTSTSVENNGHQDEDAWRNTIVGGRVNLEDGGENWGPAQGAVTQGDEYEWTNNILCTDYTGSTGKGIWLESGTSWIDNGNVRYSTSSGLVDTTTGKLQGQALTDHLGKKGYEIWSP